jgi:hypothetical protein
MKHTISNKQPSDSSGFIDGLGSLLDISGKGLGLPFRELVLQPTNVSRKSQAKCPAMAAPACSRQELTDT